MYLESLKKNFAVDILPVKVYWSGVEDFTSLDDWIQNARGGTIALVEGTLQITSPAEAKEPPDLPDVERELDPTRDFLMIGHVGPVGADFADGQHIYWGYGDTAFANYYACIANRLDWAGGNHLLFARVGDAPIYAASPRSPVWWMLKRVGATLHGGVIPGALGAPPVEGDFTAMGNFADVGVADMRLMFGNGNNWSLASEQTAKLDYLSVAYS